jgi:hypothetical protein
VKTAPVPDNLACLIAAIGVRQVGVVNGHSIEWSAHSIRSRRCAPRVGWRARGEAAGVVLFVD